MTMTSDDVMQQSTTGNVMATSSSSRDIVAYCFAYTVVFIGAAGTVANALVLYAMRVSKQHKKQMLIFNQNVLDFFSSIVLVITYGAKLGDIRLGGSIGYWLCE